MRNKTDMPIENVIYCQGSDNENLICHMWMILPLYRAKKSLVNVAEAYIWKALNCIEHCVLISCNIQTRKWMFYWDSSTCSLIEHCNRALGLLWKVTLHGYNLNTSRYYYFYFTLLLLTYYISGIHEMLERKVYKEI